MIMIAAGIGSEWDSATNIQTGATRIEAAARCFIHSKLGDQLEISCDLIKPRQGVRP